MNFEDIRTQEDFDNAIQSAVAEATASYSDYNELKETLSTMTTENTDFKTQVESLTAQLTEKDNLLISTSSELEKLKIGRKKELIAKDFGLPLDIANRINGSTDEEMQADAKELAKLFKTKAPTADVEKPIDTKKGGLPNLLSQLSFNK